MVNEKGGVGKTTTVATLGHALAQRGERVLVVDLDLQANLTAWIGSDESPAATVASALADKTAIAEAIGTSMAGSVALAYGAEPSPMQPTTCERRVLRLRLP